MYDSRHPEWEQSASVPSRGDAPLTTAFKLRALARFINDLVLREVDAPDHTAAMQRDLCLQAADEMEKVQSALQAVMKYELNAYAPINEWHKGYQAAIRAVFDIINRELGVKE